jgi:glycosyltransferase involved in cell wall biosynthesis
MLIGIDGRALSGALAGSGRYVSELCRALDKLLPEAQFLVYSNTPVPLPVLGSRWTLRMDKTVWGRHLSSFAWYMLRVGQLASVDGVTAFWGGANFLPLGLPRRIHSVLTVLDLVHKVMPQSMALKHRLAFALFFYRGLQQANVLATISRGTSERLGKFGYRQADLVIYPGVDGAFRPATDTEISTMRDILKLRGPYLLSVSTLEPRKNLSTLIAAFVTAHRGGELNGFSLVLVGQAGWHNAALRAAVAAAQEEGVAIQCTGHVPDTLLPALYTDAKAVLMPSIYEGFGLPILEARLCGAHVLATDMPETREAGGPDVTYITPTVAGIKAGLRQVLDLPRRQSGLDTMEVPRWDVQGLMLARALCPVKGQLN